MLDSLGCDLVTVETPNNSNINEIEVIYFPIDKFSSGQSGSGMVSPQWSGTSDVFFLSSPPSHVHGFQGHSPSHSTVITFLFQEERSRKKMQDTGRKGTRVTYQQLFKEGSQKITTTERILEMFSLFQNVICFGNRNSTFQRKGEN